MPLPDCYIGAHAAIEGLALLTRDAARYQTYFPKVEVLSLRRASSKADERSPVSEVPLPKLKSLIEDYPICN